ncbi:unnamed protein product [Rotaria socialis]|uniref:Uncharacterized protein n=1 Tax=Rotaria socialis TaxID=392032 RepID=A0A820Q0A4_9BILA|nr:unnamed protein product [Rotaria socialis]CAF4263725.1 unnamed protein product [Rotaria socialis]CAF4414539.1 unnamed protein product [Rotaria socialis]
MTSIGDSGEQTASQATNRPTLTTSMGIIERWRICNSDNLRDELFCPICSCLLWQPRSCRLCQNLFCMYCILKWLKTNKKCPYGCQEYKDRSCSPQMRCLLSNIQIQCQSVHYGCNAVLSYDSLETHQAKECAYASIRCQYCETLMLIGAIEVHEQECGQKLGSCSICNQCIPLRVLQQHQSSCPSVNPQHHFQNINQVGNLAQHVQTLQPETLIQNILLQLGGIANLTPEEQDIQHKYYNLEFTLSDYLSIVKRISYLASQRKTNVSSSTTDYTAVIPISIVLALISITLACLIIVVALLTKHLHTATYLLIYNTCFSSTLYCIVQRNNYIFLDFIVWDTSDASCRWRGYFAHISIVAVTYSYLIQAISRYFFVVFSMTFRWITSLKTHLTLIAAQWIVVIVLPLPSIVTNDIYYAPNSLCWVRQMFFIHFAYTFLVYFFTRPRETSRRQKRDANIFRNTYIIILFSIYIFGGLPTLIYLIFGNNILYFIGLIWVPLAVAVEKAATIFFDRELRKIIKCVIGCSKTRVKPLDYHTTIGTVTQ